MCTGGAAYFLTYRLSLANPLGAQTMSCLSISDMLGAAGCNPCASIHKAMHLINPNLVFINHTLLLAGFCNLCHCYRTLPLPCHIAETLQQGNSESMLARRHGRAVGSCARHLCQISSGVKRRSQNII